MLPIAVLQSASTSTDTCYRGQAPSHIRFVQDSNVLIDDQPWFSASDIGHLMGLHLDSALRRELDPNQQQTLPPILRQHKANVGGGLPPMAVLQSTSTSTDTLLSAKQAPPHIFCVGYY